VKGGYIRRAETNDATTEIGAGDGWAGDEEAAEEGDFGLFVVDGIEGGRDDADEKAMAGIGGGERGEREGGAEGEVGLEGWGGGGVLPGAHGGGDGGRVWGRDCGSGHDM